MSFATPVSIVEMSVTGGLMILAVLIVRALFINRLPKKTFLLLWLCVVLRLLVPFALPSTASVYSLVCSGPLSWLSEQILVERSDAACMEDGNDFATAMNPEQTEPSADAAPDDALPPGATTVSSGMTIETAADTDPMQLGSTGALPLGISPWQLVWAIGITTCAAGFLIPYIRCRREFRSSLPVENERAAAWLAAHQLRRPIEIRQTDTLSTPLTYGVIHPVILVPAALDWRDTARLDYVFEHELVHIRRFDALWKALIAATVCIHWFNPLSWALLVFANRDLELACDESVVRRHGGDARASYARTLIAMEEKKRSCMPLCNSFGTMAIEERIRAIMKVRKTSMAAVLASAALVVGIPTAFATTIATSVENPDGSISVHTQTTDENDSLENELPYAIEQGDEIEQVETSSPEANASESVADGDVVESSGTANETHVAALEDDTEETAFNSTADMGTTMAPDAVEGDGSNAILNAEIVAMFDEYENQGIEYVPVASPKVGESMGNVYLDGELVRNVLILAGDSCAFFGSNDGASSDLRVVITDNDGKISVDTYDHAVSIETASGNAIDLE